MRKLNAAIQFDGKWFVARCLDLPVTSQGETIEMAKANLKKAIELYIYTWGANDVERTVGSMSLLPDVSGAELVDALQKAGFIM